MRRLTVGKFIIVCLFLFNVSICSKCSNKCSCRSTFPQEHIWSVSEIICVFLHVIAEHLPCTLRAADTAVSLQRLPALPGTWRLFCSQHLILFTSPCLYDKSNDIYSGIWVQREFPAFLHLPLESPDTATMSNPDCINALSLKQGRWLMIASFAVCLPSTFLIPSHCNKLKVLDVSHQMQDKSANAPRLCFLISYLTDMWYLENHSGLVFTSVKRGTLLEHRSALTMSLLEDIRDVLCVILEYFGVPPEMVSNLHTWYPKVYL